VATPVPPGTLHELQEVGRDLYQLALVTSHGGNLSIRSQTDMWITGTGTMLGRLAARHISLARADGSHEGPPPSSDTVLHSLTYALGGAQAIVHGHPRHAIAASFETDTFVPGDLEGQLHLKEVPIVAAGPRHVEEVARKLQVHRIVLLRGHGSYARGQSLWEALHWTTALEESAHIDWLRRCSSQRG
jgi:L-fuculose-phosphate aldolase